LVPFFSDPIAQLAVDNTRNILFSRSERGTIQVNLQDPVTDVMISTFHPGRAPDYG